MEPITSKELLQGASVLVVALAWNEFAKSFIENVLPLDQRTKGGHSIGMLVYAIFTTILVLILVTGFNFTVNKLNGRKQSIERDMVQLQQLDTDKLKQF